MAQANLPVDRIEYEEILDEEFQRLLVVAKSLIPSLKRPSDKEVCVKYIRKCTSLNATSNAVKKKRNEFFKYFLKMLESVASSTETARNADWFKQAVDPDKLCSFWSPDKRTYMAAKVIPGFGTLVYMAVSYKPEEGWQTSGFTSYEF